MPPPTSSRLTFARLKGGFKGRWAAERVISDTTLSLLKPASYAGTFSRAFVSRLRHRAGVVLGQWQRAGGATAAFSLAAEQEQPTARVPGAGGCIVLFLLRPLNAGRRLFPRKRHADGFGAFNFATLVFLLLARHSPQAVSARAACVGCHQKYRESRDDVAGYFVLFFRKKVPKNSPADASAYFVPSNVRPPKRRV